MKIFNYLICMMIGICVAACGNDDPSLYFYNHSGRFVVNGDKKLDATFDGMKVVDTKSGVTFSWDGGDVAQVTISQIVPGHDDIVVGGVKVIESPEGNGILFEGEMAVSDTEMMVFKGSIIDMVLTIDINLVPIHAAT